MANMVGQMDIVHHTENLQNIDRSELQGLFMQLMQLADTQLIAGQGKESQLLNAFNTLEHKDKKNEK